MAWASIIACKQTYTHAHTEQTFFYQILIKTVLPEAKPVSPKHIIYKLVFHQPLTNHWLSFWTYAVLKNY